MSESLDVQSNPEPGRLRRALPDSPGVYLFKDRSGRAIYVGNAKSLKKRVLSYFRPPDHAPDKTVLMMRRAASLDFIITNTEKEAFILERNLIEKHMPRYNVVLRDDKQYPCLKLNVKEPYPRLTIVRRIKKDGALYFGPFSSAHSVRSTLKLIDRVFRLRKCKSGGLPKRQRPCLNYQMGRCFGPCTYDVSASRYHEVVRQVKLFLEGRSRDLIKQLNNKMEEESRRLNYEAAAMIRDQIAAVEKTLERQNVVSGREEDQDIIGLAQRDDLYKIVILFVRGGCLIGNLNYSIKNPGGSSPEVMEAFLKQYYPSGAFVPKEILVSDPIEDHSGITERLSDVAGKRVLIRRPRRGKKRELVRMAVENAENLFSDLQRIQGEDLTKKVQAALRLKEPPRFIEGLDISNLKGNQAVGTIVLFVDGRAHKAGYRNFRIKGVQGIDDYGMMTEMISRRLKKGNLPDLFLVDGGKGHLSAVKRVLVRQKKPYVPEVIAIAKPDENRQEEYDKIYCPGRKNPLAFRPDHPVLLYMMRVRDEAHRRAVSYHRKLRSKDMTASELDLIQGVGTKRKRLLLEHFKDIKGISMAGEEELAGIPGISRSLARNIVRYFRPEKGDEPTGKGRKESG